MKKSPARKLRSARETYESSKSYANALSVQRLNRKLKEWRAENIKVVE